MPDANGGVPAPNPDRQGRTLSERYFRKVCTAAADSFRFWRKQMNMPQVKIGEACQI
jgi:hypothetical protein